MLRLALSTVFCLLISAQVFAEGLTPSTLVGRYKVTARAGMTKVYLNFNVLNDTSFEIQRVYPGGRTDELCTGTYALDVPPQPPLSWAVALLSEAQLFKGVFTCPSDPTRPIDFNIHFESLTVEDLIRGTTVMVTTSLAPGRKIPAHVKKEQDL